jgi:putative flippase GtrA
MFKKIFQHPTSHPIIQIFRYGLVVAIAFPIDIGLLYVFTDKLHIYYVLSAILSFSISMVANYALSVIWVFSQRTKRALWKEAVMFSFVGFVGLGLTALLIWFFTSVIGIHYIVSKLIAVAFVFFWSFGARRFMFQTSLRKFLPGGKSLGDESS